MAEDTDCTKVCRGCLTSERPLRPLDRKLTSLYNSLISTKVTKSNVYPKYICCYCLGLLNKFNKFRTSCQSVEASFYQVCKSGQVSAEGIKSCIKFPYPFKTTHIQVISIHPNHEYQATEYNPIDIDNPVKNTDNVITLTENDDMKDLTIADVQTVKSESYEFVPNICGGNAVFVPSTSLDEVKVEDSDSDHNPEENCSLADLYYRDDVKIPFKNEEKTQELKFINEISQKEPKLSENETPKKILKTKSHHPSRRKRSEHELSEVKQTEFEDIDNSKISKRPCRSVKKHSKTNIELPEEVEVEFEQNIDDKRSDQQIVKKRSRHKELEKIQSVKKTNNVKKSSGSLKKRRRDELSEERQTDFEKNYDVKMVILTKEEQIKQLQERKDSFNYKESKFKCELCYHGFDLEHTFNNHMGKHKLIEGNVLCDICSWSVPKKKLKSHVDRFHKFDYICNQCGYVSKFSITAKTHYRWHKGVRYNCKICGKSFDKPTSVMGHMHLSHKDVMVKCTICEQKCIGENGLSSHMKRSHKEALGAICSDCDVQFHSFDALRRHRPQGVCQHTLRPCAVCGEGFATKQLLKTHKWELHQKRDFVCETCMKHFVDYKKYLKHMRHHEIRKKRLGGARSVGSTFVCEICGSSYSNKHLFDLHRRKSHTGERPFLCDYCGKGFTSKGFLVVHIKSHMAKIENRPPKLYPCQYCYKQFTFPANVHRHEMTTHKGLRPFHCEICGGTFTTKKGMQNHVRHTHEGVPWPKRQRKTNHDAPMPQQMQVPQHRGW